MAVIPVSIIVALGLLLMLAPAVAAVRLIEGRTPVTTEPTYKQIRGYITLFIIGLLLYTLGLSYILTT